MEKKHSAITANTEEELKMKLEKFKDRYNEVVEIRKPKPFGCNNWMAIVSK